MDSDTRTLASPQAARGASPATVVAAGILALAVAMGIGRFAFTPLLPLMLRDGTLAAPTGAEWAAFNYAGYLLGALTAARVARRPRQGLLLALAGVVLTTAGMAAIGSATPAGWGALLRGLAGVASAWVLVCASSWCLAELAQRGSARLGAWIYTGVGGGIAVAGLLACLGGAQPARWLWLELAAAAAAGLGVLWPWVRASAPHAAEAGRPSAAPGHPAAAFTPGAAPTGRSAAAAGVPAPSATRPAAAWPFVACYGVLGFGYIVPATFLPAMARQVVSDPRLFGLTWPVFGVAAALSVAAAARWLAHWPRRRVWALAHGVMALGTAVSCLSQALWALCLAALLVGGTFMVATMAGLQLARELASAAPARLLARLTAAFALGQIGGPVLVRMLGSARHAGLDALTVSNLAATLVLAASALWLRAGATRQSMHPE